MPGNPEALPAGRGRLASLGTALAVTLAVAACGGGISGKYSDDTDSVSYTFESGGKVMMQASFGPMIEMEYEKDGDRILIKGVGGATQVLEITDEGHLDMGMLVLKKVE